ncbi:putative methyltransferase DDB_G0268948 [Eucalyptus grandis]|uniref:putative methyltransferase DDB_G0268948 n=1 Tax=Eucalyptus grandis TaxID=71139 RepID=UPI00192E819F|nr:putative methyltransferase DDB_G0268948 [Eucalyptus grandis]
MAMQSPYDHVTENYVAVRPQYPDQWFSKLSALTSRHALAWDAGTGNGQAAIAVCRRVVATDISEPMLKQGIPHPRVQYLHTGSSLSEEEMVAMLRGENSVDLITVAAAVHWFDIPKFYSVAKRVLRRPGGVIAIWTYTDMIKVNPKIEHILRRLREASKPYWKPGLQYMFEEYRNLPFPFESVGLGCEGQPVQLEMPREMSFETFLSVLRTMSAVATAKQDGVDLLTDDVVKEFETAWGGSDLVRTVKFKVFMLAGTVKA